MSALRFFAKNGASDVKLAPTWWGWRGSPGGTGTVPPPARGTKKQFTELFFAPLRVAVPFEPLTFF